MTPSTAVVVGLGVTGRAVAEALTRRGTEVVTVEDDPAPRHREAADQLGVELLQQPDAAALSDLMARADVVLPSPGIPDRHPVHAAAEKAGVPLRSEFDLAREWDDRPLLAVTGTNGKTTVTTLVASMLESSGTRAAAVGNTELPLVAALDDPATEVFVVEASSFRLGHTERFEPAVGTWLNFAPDHLDVHASLATYEAAKARLWEHLAPGGTAVANADDAVVLHHAPERRTTTFGLGAPWGERPHFTVDGTTLVTPDREKILTADELHRSLPHEVANALAATATALAGGAELEGVREALRAFEGLSHRVERIATADAAVSWFDDSKATTPHATIAAVRGFDRCVLIAGGRNKGLDLGDLRSIADHLRAVVAIGEAAPEIRAVFDGLVPATTATTMAEAVQHAAGYAQAGDAVVLSPACASFDWYSSYAERGDDFARAVRSLKGDP